MNEPIPPISLTKKYWITGLIAFFIFTFAAVWIFLPALACQGVKYDWSKEISLVTLEWLGPKAAGYMWEYHENFQEYQWSNLVSRIIDAVETSHQAQVFADSFKNVDARGYADLRPLHLASARGKTQIVQNLIARGADVDARDRFQWTPLHFAVDGVKLEIAKLLIENGADVNAVSEGNKTPIDRWLKPSENEMVSLLRKHGGKTGKELDAEKTASP